LKGQVGAVDQRHAVVMVDPPDPDDQERDTVGGVLGPGVLDCRAERAARGMDGDVEDQERRRDRENGVGEELPAGKSPPL
jgi:hypothetical protein